MENYGNWIRLTHCASYFLIEDTLDDYVPNILESAVILLGEAIRFPFLLLNNTLLRRDCEPFMYDQDIANAESWGMTIDEYADGYQHETLPSEYRPDEIPTYPDDLAWLNDLVHPDY